MRGINEFKRKESAGIRSYPFVGGDTVENTSIKIYAVSFRLGAKSARILIANFCRASYYVHSKRVIDRISEKRKYRFRKRYFGKRRLRGTIAGEHFSCV